MGEKKIWENFQKIPKIFFFKFSPKVKNLNKNDGHIQIHHIRNYHEPEFQVSNLIIFPLNKKMSTIEKVGL